MRAPNFHRYSQTPFMTLISLFDSIENPYFSQRIKEPSRTFFSYDDRYEIKNYTKAWISCLSEKLSPSNLYNLYVYQSRPNLEYYLCTQSAALLTRLHCLEESNKTSMTQCFHINLFLVPAIPGSQAFIYCLRAKSVNISILSIIYSQTIKSVACRFYLSLPRQLKSSLV